MSAYRFDLKFDLLRGTMEEQDGTNPWATAAREAYEESLGSLDFRQAPAPAQGPVHRVFYVKVAGSVARLPGAYQASCPTGRFDDHLHETVGMAWVPINTPNTGLDVVADNGERVKVRLAQEARAVLRHLSKLDDLASLPAYEKRLEYATLDGVITATARVGQANVAMAT